MVYAVKIAADGTHASAFMLPRFERSVGWSALLLGVVWFGWVIGATRATLRSWSFEPLMFPMLVIAFGALLLRDSATQRLEFNRLNGTVRRSSGFRHWQRDARGVARLLSNDPPMRDWLRRYWTPNGRARLTDWSARVSNEDLVLLMLISEVFDEQLLAWWLGETLPPGSIQP